MFAKLKTVFAKFETVFTKVEKVVEFCKKHKKYVMMTFVGIFLVLQMFLGFVNYAELSLGVNLGYREVKIREAKETLAELENPSAEYIEKQKSRAFVLPLGAAGAVGFFVFKWYRNRKNKQTTEQPEAVTA